MPAPDLAALLAGRAALACGVCGATASPAGAARSRLDGRRYALARCAGCGFGFVVQPRTDFAQVYDLAYYGGRGADPAVDYLQELADPRTIRTYEWEGVLRTARRLHPGPITSWLDFGSGTGGLVRHLREEGVDAAGFDEGTGAELARLAGVPVLDDIDLEAAGPFDVVTAVEVLEHVLDPLAVLRRIAGLLAPGGLLLLTTGNAALHRLDRWSYVVPDVHISFFEPRTLVRAYREAGLVPVEVGFGDGSDGILTYRILKGLRRARIARWHRLVPWPTVARLTDRRVGLTAQPAAARA